MLPGPLGRLRRVVTLLRDPRMPRLPRYLVLLALVYLVSPVDFVPELLNPVFGYLDDAVLLWLSFRWLIRSGQAREEAAGARVVETTDRRLRP
ncbi:MAG TPA: YkvA family protein [Vicinamibacteria bacterium]|nr:YkvA family protein [Vicinamibacteria bacterium]